MQIVVKGYLYESIEDISGFESHIKEKYGVEFRLVKKNSNWVLLDRIVVPKSDRKSGIGTKAMQELCLFADINNLKLSLILADKYDGLGTTSRTRLANFYKRFGFKLNSGRHKDFSTTDSMIREPK